MAANALIDKLLRTNWTDEQIQDYIGHYESAYFAYAKDHLIRSNAASGGVVTGLLSDMLKNNDIDGALVCISTIEEGKVRGQCKIATCLEELLESQGSKYISTAFSREAIPMIKGFKGRLAVVCLPCDAKLLALLSEKDAELKKKLALVITLFCGHASQPELTEMVVDRLRPNPKAELTDFRFRSGHWRGRITAEFDDHFIVSKKFSFFSKYQNLYYFCERKCLHCHDHAGYYSDLSVGDVWLQRMKDLPIKYSGIIAKSKRSIKYLEQAEKDHALQLEPQDIREIVESQSRSFRVHYNVSARSKAGKKLGLDINDDVNTKVRWVDYLIAREIIKNYLATQTPEGIEKLKRMPKRLVTLKLYYLKLLQVL